VPRLERGPEIAGVEEVVLDRVARRVTCARSKPRMLRTNATCTSKGRLVEMPFG